MKTIKAEFKHIKSQKMLLAAVLAIMFIPFLYSVFFLKSVWNPYGDAKYLPVAVVNEDQSVKFRGKTLDVGDQLVKKLKKNDGLDWHFVSKKEADYGLGHKKYYMVITIPKDFSRNATTVLDKNPKKMELKYTTNDSLNYIGKVISEEGAKQVNSQVKETVSTSYADTVFSLIKQVGKGFDTAASGSKKLSQGSNTLSNGINTYTAGVSKVNDGVIQLQTGVVPLGQGVLRLADGSNTLANGINTYTAGVDQVNSGVQRLQSGTGALSSGVGQLANGSTTLANGITAYTNGTGQLASGLQQLNDQGANALDAQLAKVNTPQVQSLLSQLNGNNLDNLFSKASGLERLPSVAGQLYAANTMVNEAANAMNTRVQAQSTSMVNALQNVEKIQQQLNASGIDLNNTQAIQSQLDQQIQSLQQAKTALTALSGQVDTIKQLSSLAPALSSLSVPDLSSVETTIKNYSGALTSSLTTIGTNSAQTLKVVEGIDKSNLTDEQKQALENIASLNQQNVQEIQKIQSTSEQFNQSINGVVSEINKSKDVLDKLHQLQTSGTISQESINQLIQLANSINVNDMIKQIDSALAMLNTGKQVLSSNNLKSLDVSSLQSQMTQLQQGLASLAKLTNSTAQGAKEFNNQVNGTTLTNSDLVSYTNAINSGNEQNVASAITTSAARLSANGSANMPNLAQVQSFANQLKSINVMDTLNQLQQFSNGVHTAYAGAQQLTANSGALTSGAGQLANGLGQLNAQVPTLTSGINQLASGTSQLAANSGALTSGASQLANGLGQLNAQVPTLTSGVNQLASGTSQLAANSGQLTSGASQLATGNKTLADALDKGSKQVNDNTQNISSKTSNMFASPTNLKHENYSYVPNYGYALAPYMLSVALYVGALVFNLVYPIRRLSDPDATVTSWWMSKVTIGTLVALGTSLVEILLMMASGLHPEHLMETLINAFFFSLSSIFIVMLLAMALGNIGRFMGILFLVIQLGSSGGSFPIQITRAMGGFFQLVNPYLPMTYSVYGFRESLTSGLGSNQVLISVGVQLIYIVISLVLLWVAMSYQRSKVTYVDVEADGQDLNA